ncbi:MAG: Rnase Y domain-containing protein, partial [Flavobacteriales bacterium]
MELLIGLVIGIGGGGAGVFVLQNVILKNKKAQIIREAELEGENIKKDKILQAKEKFMKLKEEHETTMKDKERRLQSTEDRTKAKEKTLSQKIEEVSRKENDLQKNQADLETRVQAFELKHQELDKIQEKRVAELSKISGMSVDDAKNHLMDALKDEARTGAMTYIKDITEEAK